MSSAVAMNRKIAKQRAEMTGGDDLVGASTRRPPLLKQEPPLVHGTALQQCWQILNFHETRINRVERHLAMTSRSGKDGAAGPGIEDLKNTLVMLMNKVAKLERDNKVLLNAYLQSTANKTRGNTVTFNVEETNPTTA